MSPNHEPTMAQIQFRLSKQAVDEHIAHLEDSLPKGSPRRHELNVMRRQFAGIILRLERDIEAERTALQQPSPKKGRKARRVLVAAAGVACLCALVFAAATAGAALVVVAMQ